MNPLGGALTGWSHRLTCLLAPAVTARISWKMKPALLGSLLALCLFGCGDDDPPGTQADRLGVGAECTSDTQCLQGQSCLGFKGGYCGIEGCTADAASCPSGSACVSHDDGNTYCFRICVDKAECNLNRSLDNESNCSSNVEFVDPDVNVKACVPPSS